MNDRDFKPRRPGPSVSRGVFGFVLYLVSQLTFGVYIAWIIVPQVVLLQFVIFLTFFRYIKIESRITNRTEFELYVSENIELLSLQKLTPII